MISWICVAVLVLGYPLFWLERRRHLKRAFERGTKHLTDQMGELQYQLETARTMFEDERGQKQRFQAKNLEIQTERDQWIKLYHDQAIGHGNAQNLMMEVIDRLGAQLTSRGIKYKVPSVLQLMREEFMQNHELPSRKALELLERAKDVTQKTPELPSAS